MRSPHFTTGARIALGLIALLAVAFYYLFDQLNERVERQYLEAVEEPMVDAAHLFASIAEQSIDAEGAIDIALLRDAFGAAGRREFEARVYDLLKTQVGMNLYITDAEGTVLFDSDGGAAEGEDYAWRRDVAVTLRGDYGARSTRADEENDSSSVMFVAAPIYHGAEIVGVASVSKPQAATFTFRDGTKRRINWLIGLVLAACLLGAVFIVAWFLRPVRRLTEYARAVRRGDRIPPPKVASGELRTLGRALEEMRETLEDRKYVETYVSSLTHEMKSPVAGIRGATELLAEGGMSVEQREKFLSNIQNETLRLQSIIDRLLALSALEARKSIDVPASVDLGEVVRRVCDDHDAAIAAKGLRIEIDTAAKASVEGESFLIEMAIANLLQNAIDFSPSGGALRVAVEVMEGGRRARLSVEDEGPGVPDYARDRIFERFYSLQHPDTGRKSSGLGLCFVREAAELHGGSARLEPRVGAGSRAVLELPCELATIR